MRTGLALVIVVMACGHANSGDLYDTPMATGAAGSTTSGGSSGESSGGSKSSSGGAAGSAAKGGISGSAATGTGGGDSLGGAATGTGGGDDLGGATGGDDLGGAAGGGSGGQAGASEGGSNSGGAAGAKPCLPDVVERCDGLDNDGCDGADDGETCPAGCQGFTADKVHGYMICIPEQALAFEAAQAFCQAHDVELNLVRIDDEAENTFLVDSAVSLTQQATELWIGASDAASEDEWLWLDGTLFYDHATGMVVGDGYEGWANMRPNDGGVGEDCAALNVNVEGFHGTWNDESCADHPISFICEGP